MEEDTHLVQLNVVGAHKRCVQLVSNCIAAMASSNRGIATSVVVVVAVARGVSGGSSSGGGGSGYETASCHANDRRRSGWRL